MIYGDMILPHGTSTAVIPACALRTAHARMILPVCRASGAPSEERAHARTIPVGPSEGTCRPAGTIG